MWTIRYNEQTIAMFRTQEQCHAFLDRIMPAWRSLMSPSLSVQRDDRFANRNEWVNPNYNATAY